MKKILILEPELSGHHLSYLGWIVDGFISAGAIVSIATTQKAAKQLKNDHAYDSVDIFTEELPKGASFFGGPIADLRREFAYWSWACSVCKKYNDFDAIFFPYFDYMLNAIAIFGSPAKNAKISGICMRQIFHHEYVGVKSPVGFIASIKKILFKLFLRQKDVASVFTIDPLLKEYFEKTGCKVASKLQYLPDPSVAEPSADKLKARLRLGLPVDDVIVLVYGAVTRRKGVVELLDYIAATEKNNIHIVIAGRQDEEIEQYLRLRMNSIADKVTCLNFRVPDEVEPDLFNSCDFVWVYYDGHYTMSGQLIKAAQYGKVSVVKNEGLAGWFCSYYKLGFALDSLNVDFLDSIFCIKQSIFNSTTFDWLNMHSVEKAKKKISAIFCSS